MHPSDSFRARRPPSPHKSALTHPPPPPQPRFPQHRTGEYVGADEKLDAVRQDAAGRPVLTRKSHTGGLRKMTPGEWKLLIVIALIACAVRLFRLSKPNSVVYVTGNLARGTVAYNIIIQFRRGALWKVCWKIYQGMSSLFMSRPSPQQRLSSSTSHGIVLTAPRGF